MTKISIAEFFGEPLNYGGQEAFIINVYSNIDKKKFNFSFITPFEAENENLKELIKNNSDELISDSNEFNSNLRKKYILQTAKKYLTKKFDVVHIHSGSTFTLLQVSKIAKKNGIKKVIVHSHAAGVNTIKYKMIKFLSDLKIKKYADYFFACSFEAGKWKYPSSVVNGDKFHIIKNGIDIKKYSYNEKKRQQYREKFNIENENVIIHVGRFSREKNQSFIIDTFNEVLKLKKDSKLFLIGRNGETLEKIKEKVKSLKLEDNIIFLLNRNDVNNLINMGDVFILPSLWEGLPFTGIEAQANGIPCLFSDSISGELAITKVYNKLSLTEGPNVWAQEICKLFKNKRINTENDIRKNGYDIKDTCCFLEEIYGDKND